MQESGMVEPEEHIAGCAAAEIDAVYDCFGVVNHYGSMGFGHYTAFARPIKANNEVSPDDWHCFNDSQVSAIDASEVVTDSAYILFYRRRVFT